MSYSEMDITPYSVWYHKTTKSFYVVLGIALCSINDVDREKIERSVVYYSLTYNALRYREVSEFLDGRFVLLNTESVEFIPDGAMAPTQPSGVIDI